MTHRNANHAACLHPTPCDKCGHTIPKGTPIYWSNALPGASEGAIFHEACVPDEAELQTILEKKIPTKDIKCFMDAKCSRCGETVERGSLAVWSPNGLYHLGCTPERPRTVSQSSRDAIGLPPPSPLPRKVEDAVALEGVRHGVSIVHVARLLCAKANETGKTATFEFNQIPLKAAPGTTPEEVVEKWALAHMERAARP